MYRAEIGMNGRRGRLGYYRNRVDAAIAYDRAALQHFKEFASLNFAGFWQSPAPEHHNDSFVAILRAKPVLREFVRRALDLAEVAW